VLSHLPTETRLREIMDTRRRSVHVHKQIEYTSPAEVTPAHRGVLAFFAAAAR